MPGNNMKQVRAIKKPYARQQVPMSDEEHMYDALRSYVQRTGQTSAWNLHAYNNLEVSKAVVGGDLSKMAVLLDTMVNVQPVAEFHYTVLKFLGFHLTCFLVHTSVACFYLHRANSDQLTGSAEESAWQNQKGLPRVFHL